MKCSRTGVTVICGGDWLTAGLEWADQQAERERKERERAARRRRLEEEQDG